MRLTTVATVLMGIVASCLLLDEWNLRRHAKTGQAVVAGTPSYGKEGETIVGAVHTVNGQPIRATLRGRHVRLRSGQRVDILFQPADPRSVVLDSFWQRHYGSAIAFAAFAILLGVDLERAANGRRRSPWPSPSPGDDDLGLVSSPDGITFPDDTTPPLWDRELDG